MAAGIVPGEPAKSEGEWQDLVRLWFPELSDTRLRQVTWPVEPHPAEAGEQAQIDYGILGRWLDPLTGKFRVVWAFVMVLAYSRHMFVRPVLKMDQRSWTECNVETWPSPTIMHGRQETGGP